MGSRVSASALFWSYVQVALRKVRRQKGYAFINIAGLAVGLACSVLMMLWVRHETDFDRFHENGGSIYRLVMETKNQTAATLDARAPTPTGPAVKAEVPEVLDFCRYRTNKNYGIRVADKVLFDAITGIADPSFFTMFTFPFLKGDPKTALDGPRSVVITESVARMFFGDGDPMGKLLTIIRDPYTVTGVIRDVPENSHLHFSCVIPIVNMREYHHVDFDNWNSMFFNCYVRLAPQASPAEAATKMSGLVANRMGRSNVSLRPQPLKDVHLKSDFAFDLDNYAQGSASTLTLFSIAATAILLLACINFMNLATARSANRAKEVGLRKVTGARRSDVVRQFLDPGRVRGPGPLRRLPGARWPGLVHRREDDQGDRHSQGPGSLARRAGPDAEPKLPRLGPGRQHRRPSRGLYRRRALASGLRLPRRSRDRTGIAGRRFLPDGRVPVGRLQGRAGRPGESRRFAPVRMILKH